MNVGAGYLESRHAAVMPSGDIYSGRSQHDGRAHAAVGGTGQASNGRGRPSMAIYDRKHGGAGCPRAAVFVRLIQTADGYTTPCASIASATFKKPAMFAPTTRLPLAPYSSAAATHWS